MSVNRAEDGEITLALEFNETQRLWAIQAQVSRRENHRGSAVAQNVIRDLLGFRRVTHPHAKSALERFRAAAPGGKQGDLLVRVVSGRKNTLLVLEGIKEIQSPLEKQRFTEVFGAEVRIDAGRQNHSQATFRLEQ